MVTHKELIKREKEYESQGIFDVHIDEPDLSLMIPVTEKFPYIKKGFLKLKIAFEKAGIIKTCVNTRTSGSYTASGRPHRSHPCI